MKRLVLLAITGLAALAVPSAAQAASSSPTVNAAVTGGVLTSTSGVGAVNTVTLGWSFAGATISDSSGASGTPVGTGCGFLTVVSAYCFASSASVQTLDLNDSIANKSTLPATLDGGAGDDKVTGGTPSETLRGADGNDIIGGGGGADTIDAGAGDDQIDVRDGNVDTVDCGAGTDTVQADPGDVVSNCEIGTPVAGETATVTGDETGPGKQTTPIDAEHLLSTLTVVGHVIAQIAKNTEVTVSAKGLAPFRIACAADAASACTGVIFIDPAPAKGKRAKKAKTVTAFMARRGRYGSSPFKVRPGSEGSTQVKLTGVAMRAMGKSRRKARAARRGRRVSAIVTIAPKNTRAQRVRVTLKG